MGKDGLPLPRRRGYPPGDPEKEPHRSHPPGRGRRTLFHPSAARGVHRLRCRGPRASHRGARAPVLADEDDEQDPDRWCRHAPGFPRSLANRLSMDLERAPGTGPAVGANSAAHHPVCSSHPLYLTAHGSALGLCSPSGGLAQDRGPLLWSRLSSPAGWDAAVSCWPVAGCP